MASRPKSKRSARSGSTKSASTKASSYPLNYGQQAEVFISKPISLQGVPTSFVRADIEFRGVDHSGASFEARVFVENQTATSSTALVPKEGFVGSFHVFGHGGCFGDVGHCEVRGQPRPYDPRPAHPLTPANKIVRATDAIRGLVAKQKSAVRITVVPVVTSLTKKCDTKKVLKFDEVLVVTFS